MENKVAREIADLFKGVSTAAKRKDGEQGNSRSLLPVLAIGVASMATTAGSTRSPTGCERVCQS